MGSAASIPVEDKSVGDVDMCVESTQCVRDLVLVLQENEGIQEKRLVEAFERMDTDKDREVDLKEWKKFIRDKGSLNDDDVIRNTLKSMDTNYDGKISLDDLRSHASTNGLLVSRILSSFRPRESQLTLATSRMKELKRVMISKKMVMWKIVVMRRNGSEVISKIVMRMRMRIMHHHFLPRLL